MDNVKDLKEVMAAAGISDKERNDARSGESAYVAYQVNGRAVHVELTAPNMTESLLRLPVELQTRIFACLVNFVPNVGDHFRMTNDHYGDNKGRGVRIVRILADKPEDISLLVTR